MSNCADLSPFQIWLHAVDVLKSLQVFSILHEWFAWILQKYLNKNSVHDQKSMKLIHLCINIEGDPMISSYDQNKGNDMIP